MVYLYLIYINLIIRKHENSFLMPFFCELYDQMICLFLIMNFIYFPDFYQCTLNVLTLGHILQIGFSFENQFGLHAIY